MLARLGGGVVTQVGRQIDVHARRSHLREQPVAGATADGDAAHRPVRIAGGTDALRGDGQPLGGPHGQLRQPHRAGQFADAAQSAPPLTVGRIRHQGTEHPQVERAGQGVGDAGVRGVGVGVGDVQGDAVPDERVDDAALEGVGRDSGRTPQIEGVVGDQQSGTELDGLVGDLLNRVDGEEDPVDLGVRTAHIAAHRADGVPLLGPLARPEDVERGDDFGEFGHG